MEKEILTPGSDPLTHNSLLIACNQTSSRDPITHFIGEEVSEALRGLSEKYLVEKILGGRAPKFEHCLPDVLSMQPSERAVLTVLLLRGPQSAIGIEGFRVPSATGEGPGNLVLFNDNLLPDSSLEVLGGDELDQALRGHDHD